MTTVQEAFDALGYELHDNETVCVAQLVNGRMTERSLHDVADDNIGENRYFSTGTFDRDTK